MHVLQQVLSLAGIGLAGALIIRLALTRLARAYLWFFVFLCCELLRNLVFLFLSPRANLYGYIFLITQPLTWLLYILVTLELYSAALRERRGLATLGQWTVSFGMILAVGVSALTLWADLSRPVGRYPILVYYSVIERGLLFSLALFLVLIIAFLSWFPLAVPRNIRVHAGVYSLYFLASTLAIFLRNVRGYSTTPLVNVFLSVITIVCYALWLSQLNRKGEEQLVTGRRWRPEDEEKLLRQMDALNDAVLRRSRD